MNSHQILECWTMTQRKSKVSRIETKEAKQETIIPKPEGVSDSTWMLILEFKRGERSVKDLHAALDNRRARSNNKGINKINNNEEIKAQPEADKLAIMQAFREYLNSKAIKVQPTPEEQAIEAAERVKQEAETSWHTLYTGLFNTLIARENLPLFLQTSTLLQFIPIAFSNPVAYALSAIISVIEGTIHYAYMYPILDGRLGDDRAHRVGDCSKRYLGQFEVTEDIQKTLSSAAATSKMSVDEYEECAEFSKSLSKNIEEVRKNYPAYKESEARGWGRWIMNAVGLAQDAVGSWFLCQGLLATVGPVLALLVPAVALPPVAFGLTILLSFGPSLIRTTLRVKGLYEFMNPDAEQHEKTEKKLKGFKAKDKDVAALLKAKKVNEVYKKANEVHKNCWMVVKGREDIAKSIVNAKEAMQPKMANNPHRLYNQLRKGEYQSLVHPVREIFNSYSSSLRA